MRILLLTHYYPPESGAPQQRWAALAEHFVAAGHELTVIAPSPHYPHGSLLPEHAAMAPGAVHPGPHGETVHRVAYRGYAGDVGSRFVDQLVAARAAVRTARTVGARTGVGRAGVAGAGAGPATPQVVVATVPSLPMLWAGRRVAARLGVPVVAEMRDAWPDLLTVADEWDTISSGRAKRAARRVSRGGLTGVGRATTHEQRRADAVVTTTDTFAQALRGRGMGRVHVVRNGAHPVPGYAGHTPRDAADGTLNVLYAGTMGRAQGLATAVQAAALAGIRGTRVRLRLVGDGADRPQLVALAAAERVEVEFVEPVPRAAMGEHYAWCDTVLVCLRPWPALELTVPSKLYEAMALGVHVTGSVAGEAAEIITGAHAGHVATPGDAAALAELWESVAADRSRLDPGTDGIAWVGEHAEDSRLARDYLEILDGVVTGRG